MGGILGVLKNISPEILEKKIEADFGVVKVKTSVLVPKQHQVSHL